MLTTGKRCATEDQDDASLYRPVARHAFVLHELFADQPFGPLALSDDFTPDLYDAILEERGGADGAGGAAAAQRQRRPGGLHL